MALLFIFVRIAQYSNGHQTGNGRHFEFETCSMEDDTTVANVSTDGYRSRTVFRYRSANNVRPRRSPEFYVYRDTPLDSPRHQDQRRDLYID